MNAQQLVDKIIPHKIPKQTGIGQASINIALSKYWGKRNVELNLPTNSSLSISLPSLGTVTKIELINTKPNAKQDKIFLNAKQIDNNEVFAQRLSSFLNYFRTNNFFKITTTNTVPTAAGLASSASGYAALVLALNDCFQWQLTKDKLSILARLGSGSAARSIFNGFVIWHKGQQQDGLDSYAQPMDIIWQEFCIGLITVNEKAKKIGSTQGMQQTLNTCELYQAWPKKAEQDLIKIKQAIVDKNFVKLAKTAENNALSMHATMIATIPPILYWQPESVTIMHKVWQLREQGLEVYFTMDAGPNIKLMFLENDEKIIKDTFKKINIIKPFEGFI